MTIRQSPWQTLQRVFLWTIIVSFSLSALYGIAVLLGADAGTLVGSQVIASALIIGSFSLAMLCCGVLFHKPERPLGITGVVISTLSMIGSLWFIWAAPSMPTSAIEILFTGITLTAACTFVALLLAATSYRDTVIRSLLGATLVFVAITTVLLLLSIWSIPVATHEYFSRAQGIAVILAVVTAIITPILSFLRRKVAPHHTSTSTSAQTSDPYHLDAATAAALEAEARRQQVSVAQLVTPILQTRTDA